MEIAASAAAVSNPIGPPIWATFSPYTRPVLWSSLSRAASVSAHPWATVASTLDQETGGAECLMRSESTIVTTALASRAADAP